MILPYRVATRLKLLASATVFALALPAFTGFDRTTDGEAARRDGGWSPSIPFSMGAWRQRVGSVEEAIYDFVTRTPPRTEAAHPQQPAAFGADDPNLSPLATYGAPDKWSKEAQAPAPLDPSTLIGAADAEILTQALSGLSRRRFHRRRRPQRAPRRQSAGRRRAMGRPAAASARSGLQAHRRLSRRPSRLAGRRLAAPPRGGIALRRALQRQDRQSLVRGVKAGIALWQIHSGAGAGPWRRFRGRRPAGARGVARGGSRPELRDRLL